MEGADWRRRDGQSPPTTLDQRRAAPWQSSAPLAAPRRATKLYVTRADYRATAYRSSMQQRCRSDGNGRIQPEPSDAGGGRRLAAEGAPLSKESRGFSDKETHFPSFPSSIFDVLREVERSETGFNYPSSKYISLAPPSLLRLSIIGVKTVV